MIFTLAYWLSSNFTLFETGLQLDSLWLVFLLSPLPRWDGLGNPEIPCFTWLDYLLSPTNPETWEWDSYPILLSNTVCND